MNEVYQVTVTDEMRDHLETILEKKKSEEIVAAEVITTSETLLEKLKNEKHSQPILDSIEKLKQMLAMLTDESWDMRENNKKYVLAVLSYFCDEEGLIPDNIPGIGLLDDAIMINLVAEKLSHERDAYNDYCGYLKAYAESPMYKNKGMEPNKEDWVLARKQELRNRLKRRRRRDGMRNGMRGSSFTII